MKLTQAARGSVFWCVLTVVPATAVATDPPCRMREDLKGACFEVEGKLRLFNGTPSARIQSAEGRVLGVVPWFDKDNETFSAPEPIRKRASFDGWLPGPFTVCPLEKPAEGRMQRVCVEGRREPTTTLCICAEATLPIDIAADLNADALPPDFYFVQVDDGAPIAIRSDHASRVEGLASDRPHQVSLLRNDKRVASLRLDRLGSRAEPTCIGLSNYEGLSRFETRQKRCDCRER